MKTSALAIAAALGFFAALGGQAQAIAPAGATIDIMQVGPNVVMMGSGVIDLLGLTPAGSGPLGTNGICLDPPPVGEPPPLKQSGAAGAAHASSQSGTRSPRKITLS